MGNNLMALLGSRLRPDQRKLLEELCESRILEINTKKCRWYGNKMKYSIDIWVKSSELNDPGCKTQEYSRTNND